MPWNKKKGMPKVDRKMHKMDATGKVVGRLASEIATLLIGKHKPTYMPNVDAGDSVEVTNVEKLVFTGNKMADKKYYRSSGRPGGLKEMTAEEAAVKDPTFILKNAVKYMLPKNKLQNDRLKRLKIS